MSNKVILSEPWYSYAMGTAEIVPDLMPDLPPLDEELAVQTKGLTKNDIDQVRVFREFLKNVPSPLPKPQAGVPDVS